jgi:hypothetical protein
MNSISRAGAPHDPLDGADDLYSALSVHDDFLIGDPDDGEMLPIGRDQLAAALAWRRRLERQRESPD